MAVDYPISLGTAMYLLSLVLGELAAHSRDSATTGDFMFHADRTVELVPVTLNLRLR